MIKSIGDNAGKIWNYLNSLQEEITVASLRKKLELKPEEATLALGWLARENNLEIKKSGNSIKVKLK